MTDHLQRRVDKSIRLIQTAVGDNTVEISYSGGKDSDVILELAKMAGVKYRVIYKNTTIDPPGTIAHCKENGAEILNPKENFFKLIEKSGFPTRRVRFCCGVLKEYKVMDMAIQGIRQFESPVRAKRYNASDPVICRIYGNKSNHVNVILPLLEWTDNDVAAFVNERGIKCHPLYYDENGVFRPERRLGCIGCPMSQNGAIRDFKKYPKMLVQWIKSGKKWLDARPNGKTALKFHNIYNLMYHNLFCKTFEEYIEKTNHGKMDTKKFLEKTFNIKLP